MTTTNGHKGKDTETTTTDRFAAKAHETVDTIAERAQRAEREVRGAAARTAEQARQLQEDTPSDGRAKPSPREFVPREQSARVRRYRVRGRPAAEQLAAALRGACTLCTSYPNCPTAPTRSSLCCRRSSSSCTTMRITLRT